MINAILKLIVIMALVAGVLSVTGCKRAPQQLNQFQKY